MSVGADGSLDAEHLLRARDPKDDRDLDIGAAAMAANLRAKLFGAPRRPIRVGRYEIAGTIGSGGMGVVYAARDPELDRPVAVKLLHREDGPETQDRDRMLHEAQALARLSHAHVVQIYEVGTHDGRVFLAMEFLPGPTMAVWQAEGGHTWREILDKYLEAGEGLAAAHAEGLVHRDLKPDNLLLGSDGRVRVVDFGLARALTESTMPEDSSAAVAALMSTSLSGTPAYMSPEQVRHRAVDARSDQYSFAVALHEALFGQRPHSGDTSEEVLEAIAAGRLRPVARGSVPAHVARAVTRALSREPEERFESMPALLAELRRDPGQSRRRVLAALGVGALAVAAAWPTAADDPCTASTRRADTTWDDSRRESVRDAFEATALPYAARAWDEVDERLSGWTEAWRVQREGACRAYHVERSLSAELHDLRVACLDRVLAEVEALGSELSDADAEVVRNAAASVAELPPLSQCDSAERLRRGAPPPDDDRVEDIEQDIAAAAANERVGRFDDAAAAADNAVAVAQEVGHGPLLARALRQRARISRSRGRITDAVDDFEAAWVLAYEAAADELVLEIWLELARTAGEGQLGELGEQALAWTSAAMNRVGASDLGRARLAQARSNLSRHAGDYEAAAASAEEALAEFEKALPEDAPELAAAHRTLAAAYGRTKSQEEALAEQRRALEIGERLLGPDHPDLARDDYNIALTLNGLKRNDEARPILLGALRRRGTTGPDALLVSIHLLFGKIAKEAGNDAAVEEHSDQAWAAAQALDPSDPRWAMALGQRAEIQLKAGKHAEALEAFERIASTLGRYHSDDGNYWVARLKIAEIYLQTERYADAVRHFRELLAGLAGSKAPRKDVITEAASDGLADAEARLEASAEEP